MVREMDGAAAPAAAVLVLAVLTDAGHIIAVPAGSSLRGVCCGYAESDRMRIVVSMWAVGSWRFCTRRFGVLNYLL